jgi:hypothetical protein
LPASATPARRRWSLDAWLLARPGGDVAALGPGVPTYGASQIGAVLRYRLGPALPRRPTAYLRMAAALNGSGERGLALGFSARPVAAIPVILAAELRGDRLAGGGFHARPAIEAITELPVLPLPGGAHAEAYAAAGYVGGAAATPFVDGQLRAGLALDRRSDGSRSTGLDIGGGLWGGAQRGTGRLDAGPALTMTYGQGAAAARVEADWRFRIAGNAAPASGPAITVAAGF